MAVMQDFDWFVDRLDLARWESETSGQRSGFFSCPVHGGSDSLHLTEKNGKALVKCFGCDADVFAVTEAIEDQEEGTHEDAPPVTVTRRNGGARKRSSGEPVNSGPAGRRGVRLPAASTKSPLAWMAERCGLTAKQLMALELPISEQAGKVVFEFPNDAAKVRGTSESKKDKGIAWQGAYSPPLWPTPEDPGEDIVVCEGEADAICLRASQYEAYSVTKGSRTEVPAVVWEALAAAGVKQVRVVFDMDDSGRKGRDQALAGLRAAGIEAHPARVEGIQVLSGEKDARDVAVRQGYPLVLEDDADEDTAVPLSEVESVLPEPLTLDRLHSTEHTILFGDGGTGKGVIAAWWVARLTRDKKKVLVVDYEQHARFEWRPRVEGFGGDMDRVFIVQPTRPIWDIASWIRSQALRYDVDYVVVDSVAYACVGQEVEKSITATEYSMAVSVIGFPTLSIAHVTKANADPNHPFGSIFWSNGARVTVAVSRKDPNDPESPRVLRNAKTNQRGPFRTVAIDWSWLGQDGPPGCACAKGVQPRHLHEKAAYKNKADAVRGLAQVLGRMPTIKEVEEEAPDLGPFTTADVANAFRGAHSQYRPIGLTRTRRATGDDTDG